MVDTRGFVDNLDNPTVPASSIWLWCKGGCVCGEKRGGTIYIPIHFYIRRRFAAQTPANRKNTSGEFVLTHSSMLLRISAFFASSDDGVAAAADATEDEDGDVDVDVGVAAAGASAAAGDDCTVVVVVAAFWSSESTASTAAAILFLSLVALLTTQRFYRNRAKIKKKSTPDQRRTEQLTPGGGFTQEETEGDELETYQGK